MKNPKKEMRRFNPVSVLKRQITIKKRELQAMNRFNVLGKRKLKAQIQALEEGGRDILNTTITNTASVVSSVPDKNNYATYAGQVQQAYEMYNAETDYGGELTKGLIDSRVAFIAGEGLSVNSENKKKLEWIEDFLEYNKLHGSHLAQWIRTGELEGKNLINLKKGKAIDKETGEEIDVIKAHSWKWNYYKYTINLNPRDHDIVQKITYKEKGDISEERTINPKISTYVKLGGEYKDINLTPARIHTILTQIENYSRANYDLRKNTHLFGRYVPYWKTDDAAAARTINTMLQANDWEVGTAYAGAADFSIVEPTGAGGNAIISDMLSNLRIIATMMSIPIHMLSHPELMSNRATADNLFEVVINGTKTDKMIWEESIKEIIQKALIMAVDELGADNAILKGDFQVKLPNISIALLKQLIEVWYPLLQDNIISEFTFRNMLPGINPIEEAELAAKEKEERIAESPLMEGLDEGVEKVEQEETSE